MRVLILDDQAERHDDLQTTIQEAGAEFGVSVKVIHAWSAPQALRGLEGPIVDLLLLDCDLGRNDGGGLDVARAMIRSRSIAQEAPIVIVHSHNCVDGPKAAEELRRGGFGAVWSPFGPGTVTNIRALIRQRRATDATE